MIYHYYFPNRTDGRNGDSTFAVVYYNTATGSAETKATGIKDLQPALDQARAFAELKLQALHSDDHMQIVKLAHRPAAGRKLRMVQNAVTTQAPELQEGCQVHQSVPVHFQRAERKRDGVELGMGQHGARTRRLSDRIRIISRHPQARSGLEIGNA